MSTITRRLAAIGQVHQFAGHPNPAAETIVREAMRGIRRALGVAPVQKRAVTTADIAAVVAQLDEVTLIDLRDRVILLVGFAGGMRRSELAGIHVDDVTSAPEGLLIRLRRSKTDPGAGAAPRDRLRHNPGHLPRAGLPGVDPGRPTHRRARPAPGRPPPDISSGLSPPKGWPSSSNAT